MKQRWPSVALGFLGLTVAFGAWQGAAGAGLACARPLCTDAPVTVLLAVAHRLSAVGLLLVCMASAARTRSAGAALASLLTVALFGVGLAAERSLLASGTVAVHVGLSLGLVGVLAISAWSPGPLRWRGAAMTPLLATAGFASCVAASVGWHSASACTSWPMCEPSSYADAALPGLQHTAVLAVLASAVALSLLTWRHAALLGMGARVLPRVVLMVVLCDAAVVFTAESPAALMARIAVAHVAVAGAVWLFARLQWLGDDQPANSALPSSASPVARGARS